MNPHSDYSYLGYSRYQRPESSMFADHNSSVQYSGPFNLQLDNLNQYVKTEK